MFDFDKCIEIIEEDKDKYGFMKGAHSNSNHKRCLIGLLLSHYGWDGKGHPFNHRNIENGTMAPLEAPWDELHKEVGDWYKDTPSVNLAALSDRCDSWDQVIVELKALKTK